MVKKIVFVCVFFALFISINTGWAQEYISLETILDNLKIESTHDTLKLPYNHNTNQNVHDFAHLFGGLPYRIPSSMIDLKAIYLQLGEPERIETREISNRFSDSIDYIYKYIYKDIEITLYYITNSDKYLTLEVHIFSDRFDVEYGLKVGSSLSLMVETLGSPTTKGDNCLIYFSDEKLSYVAFYYEDDHIKSISWVSTLT